MTNTTTIEIKEALSLDENIQKLIDRANEIQSKCNDHIVTADEITMDDALNLQFNGNIMPLSTLATGHICGKLRIPTAYFNRCAEVQPQLAVENMNAWLAGDSRKFMLRTHEDKIRGVLSGSYSKFDAPEILRSMDEALGFENYKMKGSLINEERLHVRLVEKEMLPIDVEDLIEEIKTKTLLSDESVEEVIYLMDKNYGNNRWGMINGITEVAQKFTLDRRLQLEEIAGSMLVR